MKTIEEQRKIKYFEIECEKKPFCRRLLINYCTLAELTFKENPVQFAQAKNLCERFTKWLFGERKFNSLMIQGGVGTGKTTLFWALIETKEDMNKCGVKHNLTNFTRAVRFDEEDVAADIEGFIEYYSERKALIIDDLGAEEPEVKVFGHPYHPLERILKRRSDDKLPTIITTNLSIEQIQEQYKSERLADVLAQYDKLIIDNPQSFRRL